MTFTFWNDSSNGGFMVQAYLYKVIRNRKLYVQQNILYWYYATLNDDQYY